MSFTNFRIAVFAIGIFLLAFQTDYAQGQKIIQKLEPATKKSIVERLDDLQAFLESASPVDPSMHSNGCGPSWLPGFPLLINEQRFTGKDTHSKLKVMFKVNFKPACDLHDTGYAGLFVLDRFGATPTSSVDFSTWSKESIDRKFYYDLCKICDQLIPESNNDARKKCKSHNLGALAYYWAVKVAGRTTFDCNLNDAGLPWQTPCTRNYGD